MHDFIHTYTHVIVKTGKTYTLFGMCTTHDSHLCIVICPQFGAAFSFLLPSIFLCSVPEEFWMKNIQNKI